MGRERYRLHSAHERVAFRLFLTNWLWLDMNCCSGLAWGTRRTWAGGHRIDGWE